MIKGLRPLQTDDILPVGGGHAMIENFKENKHVKAEALIKHLDEKRDRQH